MPVILPSLAVSAETKTAGDLVLGALRLLRVWSSDTTLPAQDMEIGLSVLNELIGGLSTEGLTLSQVVRDSFTISAPQASYTWGTGGDWATTRPTEILQCSFTLGTIVDIPVSVVTYDDYEAVRMKSLVTNVPMQVYPDYGYPLCRVYVYPQTNGGILNFQSYKPWSEFLTQEQEVSMPPGYFRMLRYNLAVELASEYQINPGATVVAIAQASLSKIKTLNYKPTTAQVDSALRSIGQATSGRFNPYFDHTTT